MDLVQILLWIVFGGVAGWVATMIMGQGGRGWLFNIIIGIIGAFLGGWLSTFIPGVSFSGFTIEGFIVAVLGAVVLLFVAGLIRKRR